jgi:hypothetical protein
VDSLIDKLWFAILVFNALDYAISYYAIVSLGMLEANPVWSFCLHKFGLTRGLIFLALAKALAMVAILFLSKWARVVILIWFVLVVLFNAYQIIKVWGE